ncbi:unnamed protein product [Ceratitis capitata]|uniref:(Mediterranean fruit fly) hypothetical protein n=1 Tax=Ceratitis capitata TaxID=7213 RepID=A0A811U697_CERCA|nr:unnamed protein product [Ceratitis capitata]
MKLIALLITLALVLRRTYGYYIPQNELKPAKNDWNIFKQKLGLSADKVELLKSQKNQQYTMNLVNRFIEENPKYVAIHEKSENQEKKTDNFSNFYRSLVKNLPSSEHTLKTSLNFELNDDDKNRVKT